MLPIKSQIEILSDLQGKKLEDISVIKNIESQLIKLRKYIFKIPQPSSKVMLTLSGGLDSTILWGMLMKEYKLEVYPVFFLRGHKRVKREEEAIRYFSHFFYSKYPSLFHEPYFMKSPIPPQEIRWEITERSQEYINITQGQMRGIPLYSGLLAFNAVEYAYYLELSQQVKIRTIFSSFVSSDGISLRYETLTALRSLMYSICTLTNEYDWQFTSLAIEKELGHYWDKDILIKWANKMNYPLEKTFSCISDINYKIHCGQCFFCRHRKESFRKAKVPDLTEYKYDSKELFSYS